MKKTILLLLISLSMTTLCFSQTTLANNAEDSIIVLTPTQLKQTNLIFNEHSKLLKENDILKSEIIKYEELTNNYIRLDSINQEKEILYKEDIITQQKQINNLNKQIQSLKKKDRVKNWIICGVSGYAIITTILKCLKL